MPPTRPPARSVPQPAPDRRHVFVSYSHADRAWVERLKRMMAPLLRGGGQELRLWDDSRIAPGMRWREEIETALAAAKVALLLVSDDFLASEFVMGEEVPALLAAAEAEGVTVLWVSLSPSFVEETEIHHYQAVLPPHRHLAAMPEVEVKEALKAIGQAIRKALREPPVAVRQGPAAAAATPAVVAAAPEAAPVVSSPESRAPRGERPLVRESLPTEPHDLETARVRRQGESWRVERQPLRVERALLPLDEGISLPLVWIPAGEFVMGSPLEEAERSENEGPQHRVRLEGFWLGQTPVTQAQWRAVARLVPPLGQRWERPLPATPSRFRPGAEDAPLYGQFSLLPGERSTDQRPVERVSWHDAMEFCRRVDTLLPAGGGLRCTLPSEAQWEYACRAGTATTFHFGATITPELANYDGNHAYGNGPKGEYRKQTTAVGMFPANDWGLLDMHGNVWEWCLDHLHETYDEAPFDGRAWVDALEATTTATKQHSNDMARDERRLLRGGSWFNDPQSCRSAYRNRNLPDFADDDRGFRVCCLPQD
jgi:formylglycine-generating enzyme required for sulfatase activity